MAPRTPNPTTTLEIEVNVRAPAKAQSRFQRFMGTDPAKLEQRISAWLAEQVAELGKAPADKSVEVVE